MKMIMWYRIDAAVKLRMAELGGKLTYEERLQRMEELCWVRDEIKSLIEEKEYEPAIQESTDEKSEPFPEPEKLERGEAGKWPLSAKSDGGLNPCGSRGRCSCWKCTVS